MKRFVLVALLVAGAAYAGVSYSSGPSAEAPAATATSGARCGTSTTPAITHVLVFAEENHGYTSIIGPAPTITALAHACAVLTDAHGVQYPSLPNYIALTNGAIPNYIATSSKPNRGKDCLPSTLCSVPGSGLFGQVSWKQYAETMQTNCQKTNVGTSGYRPKHAPAVYYPAIAAACKIDDVPLGTTSAGALRNDLASGNLAAFSFVVPNELNDMHDGTVAQGDAWLAKWLPLVWSSPAYQDGSTAVIIWMDTGQTANRIPIVVASPSTPAGLALSTTVNHYGLLHTIESTLGVACLHAACSSPDLSAALGL